MSGQENKIMSNPVEQLLTECIVIDTETTSLDFKEAEVIQYAGDNVLSIERFAENGHEGAVPAQFFTTETPITAETSSITTITGRMVAGSPKFAEKKAEIEADINSYKYMVAHNSYYDEGIFKVQGISFRKPSAQCALLRSCTKTM